MVVGKHFILSILEISLEIT